MGGKWEIVNRARSRAASRPWPDLRIWPDMPHVFQGCAAFLPEARAALAEAGRFLDAHMLRAERQATAAA